jgi:hypothetical protein
MQNGFHNPANVFCLYTQTTNIKIKGDSMSQKKSIVFVYNCNEIYKNEIKKTTISAIA